MTVSIEDVKAYCQVDHTEDDALLELLSSAATQQVVDHLRVDLDASYPAGWPNPCRIAVMELVKQRFDDRTGVNAEDGMSPRLRMMLAPYRDMS